MLPPVAWRVAQSVPGGAIRGRTLKLDQAGHYLTFSASVRGIQQGAWLVLECSPSPTPPLIGLTTDQQGTRFLIVPASPSDQLHAPRTLGFELEEQPPWAQFRVALAGQPDAEQLERLCRAPALGLESRDGLRASFGARSNLEYEGEVLGEAFLSLLQGAVLSQDQGIVTLEPLAEPRYPGSTLEVRHAMIVASLRHDRSSASYAPANGIRGASCRASL